MRQRQSSTEETSKMRRIIMIVLRLFFKAPYYALCIWWYSKNNQITYEKAYELVRRVTQAVNLAGKITVKSYGAENIPKENGFIFYPNHQGLYDVLNFLESCPIPFAFVIKKEMGNVFLVRRVIKALGAICIDREDVRQAMQVINQVAEEVKQGRNFLIFPEGTRSKHGNQLLPFKGGSFKCAVKAKCPIVPCALIDSFKPFDEKSIQPVTVKVIYLPPLYYEEYRNMKTVEIAEEVKNRIEQAIRVYEKDF